MGDLEPTPDIAELWHEVMVWLTANAPVTADALRVPGTPRADVDAAAAGSGLDWPEELRVWFTLHDGGGDELALGGQLFPMFVLDRLVEALHNRQGAVALGRELMATVGPGLIGDDGQSSAGQDVAMFLPEFVPIATDPGYGHLVVDLRPGPMRGGVTTFTYDSGTAYGGDGAEGFTWPNLTSLVSDLRDALVEGTSFRQTTAEVAEGELFWPVDMDDEPYSVLYIDADLDYVPGLTSDVAITGDGPDEHDVMSGVTRGYSALPPRPPGWQGPWPPAGWDSTGGAPMLDDWDGSVPPPGYDGPWPPADGALGLTALTWDAAERSARPTLDQLVREMGSPAPPDFSAVPDVATVWSELLAWLDANAPATAGEIERRGSAAAEIAAAEAETGVEWTEELRTWFTLQSGDSLSTGQVLLLSWDVIGLDEAMNSRSVHEDVADDVEDDLDRMSDTEAGTPTLWHRAFVPIGDSHTGQSLVVDLRPGPRRGCVLAHDWEDGGVGMGYADEWPSVAAMLWEHLEVMRTGDPGRLEAVAVVSDEGHLEWRFV